MADADENGSIDQKELFLFIRNYEKFKADRDGLVALIKNFTEKISNSGRLKLARRILPKLLKVLFMRFYLIEQFFPFSTEDSLEVKIG